MIEAMRIASIIALTLASSTLACAGRPTPTPDTSTPSTGPITEHQGLAVDDDRCSPYLADAPPPQSGEFMELTEDQRRAAAVIAAQQTQPRCAHYQLIHRVLATHLFDDPRLSFVLWEAERPTDLLGNLATIVNDACVQQGEQWLMPENSFSVGRTHLLGRPLVIVDVIPPPVAMTEAYMFAVVGEPWTTPYDQGWTGIAHYFVLEHNIDAEPTHTVFGGWTMSEDALTHLNMGLGPSPTPDAFVHAIGRNLCANFIHARTRIER
jgi:hypothetical protein